MKAVTFRVVVWCTRASKGTWLRASSECSEPRDGTIHLVPQVHWRQGGSRIFN